MTRMVAGLKKPAFLPDFGKDKRKALLDRFYTNFDRQASGHRRNVMHACTDSTIVLGAKAQRDWWCCCRRMMSCWQTTLRLSQLGTAPSRTASRVRAARHAQMQCTGMHDPDDDGVLYFFCRLDLPDAGHHYPSYPRLLLVACHWCALPSISSPSVAGHDCAAALRHADTLGGRRWHQG